MSVGRSRRRLGAALLAFALLAASPARAADALPAHGFVGAEVQPVTLAQAQALGRSEASGVFVRDLLSWGPAYAAGLRRGDLVTAYDGVAVSGLAHVVALVQARRPGETVAALVHRRGADMPVNIDLGAFPGGWAIATEQVAVVPRLGLRLRALTETARREAGIRWGSTGVLVVGVEEGGVAAAIGLKPGDLLVAADRRLLIDPAEAEAALADAAVLLVERPGGFRAVRLDGAPLPPVRQAGGALWQPLAGQGLLVLDVAHDTPAAAAGLRPGDLAAGDDPLAARLSVSRLGDGAVTVSLKDAPPPPPPQTAEVALLGATVASLSPDVAARLGLRHSARGVAVTATAPGGRAAAMGLRPGLVVVSVDQVPVAAPAELTAALARAEARGTAEAVLLIEGPQGFRILGLPLTEPANAAAQAPAPLLQWNQAPAD